MNFPWPWWLAVSHHKPGTRFWILKETTLPIGRDGLLKSKHEQPHAKDESYWDLPVDQQARKLIYPSVGRDATQEPGTTLKQDGDHYNGQWRHPPVLVKGHMHTMRGHLKARCFVSFAGIFLALDADLRWPILWQNGHALYYPHNFLFKESLTEEEQITTALSQQASQKTTKDAVIKFAAKWQYGDVPTQDEILCYTDVLINNQRRMIATKPRPIAVAKGNNPTAHVKYWLADIGCGYDLVSRNTSDT